MFGNLSRTLGKLLMGKWRKVIFDTNFFGWLNRIDTNCELVELLCELFEGKGVADYPQLLKMNYCLELRASLSHHNITDEQTALFLISYKGRLNLQCVHDDDPTDLKLVVCAVQNGGSVFLSCESALLQLSDELGLEHWCFKAAIHKLDGAIGGVFGEPIYQTQSMFDTAGTHSFFHYYAKNKRCPQCDTKSRCQTKSNPPVP